MARIFISHNSNDAKEALALKRWLADNGWDDTFLDIDAKEGLSPGARWKDALKNSTDRCEAVLCLISPTWLASAGCRLDFREHRTGCAFLTEGFGHLTNGMKRSASAPGNGRVP